MSQIGGNTAEVGLFNLEDRPVFVKPLLQFGVIGDDPLKGGQSA